MPPEQPPDEPSSATEVRTALALVHQLFERASIWHCLAYGTLLGAVRDRSVIAWDTDFDLFVRPADVPRILTLTADDGDASGGVRFVRVAKPGAHLAMGSASVAWFEPARLAVSFGGRKVGDVYFPTLFDDGVLRIYDLEAEVLWTPHSSFPHFFLEQLGSASIDGVAYPAPRYAERFLEGVYGEDWRTPYRAVQHGGETRAGHTTHGDRYLPKLAEERRWCRDRGWDDSVYARRALPHWPRTIRGAGPIGPTDRTTATSRALWWRDLREVAANF